MYFILTILQLVFTLSSSKLELEEPARHDTTLLVVLLSPAEGNTTTRRTRVLNITLETEFSILIWTE